MKSFGILYIPLTMPKVHKPPRNLVLTNTSEDSRYVKFLHLRSRERCRSKVATFLHQKQMVNGIDSF